MKKTGWLVACGAAVVLAGGGYAGAVWWSGTMTEAAFRARAEALSADPAIAMTVAVVSYERGFLGATAVTRVTPRGVPGLFLELDHRITHGPHPEIGWGAVETRLRGPESLKAVLDALFGGQAAVTLASRLPFEGGSITEIVSPPFSRTDGGTRSTWGGLSGRLTRSPESVATIALEAPGLTVQGFGGVLSVGPMSADGEWNLSGPNSLHWTGRSAFRVQTADVSGAFGRYGVRGLAVEGWQKDEGATLASGSRMTVGSIVRAGDGAPEPLLSAFVLEMDAERLDRQALGDFMSASESLQQSALAPEEQSGLLQEALARLVEGLAARSPRFSLKQLALDSPHGALRAQGHIEVKPAAPVARTSDAPVAGGAFAAMTQRLSGHAVVEVSPELVRYGLEKRTAAAAWAELSRRGEPLDGSVAAQMAARMAEDRLRTLVEAGLLRAEGERLRVEAVLEGGELRLNGLTSAEFMSAVAGIGAGGPAGE